MAFIHIPAGVVKYAAGMPLKRKLARLISPRIRKRTQAPQSPGSPRTTAAFHYIPHGRYPSSNASTLGNRWQRRVYHAEDKHWHPCRVREYLTAEQCAPHLWERHPRLWQPHPVFGAEFFCNHSVNTYIIFLNLHTYTISRGFVKT